jgi:hypothetical protein
MSSVYNILKSTTLESNMSLLPKGGYEAEAQCDINLSLSPLLKHYLLSIAGIKIVPHFF